MGFMTWGLENGGNTRMEVKITGEWGTGQGVPHTLGMMDKAENRKGRRHRALRP